MGAIPTADQIRQAAVHEAAHAVAARQYGRRITRLSVLPDDDRKGGTWIEPAPDDLPPTARIGEAIATIVIAMIGDQAVTAYLLADPTENAGADESDWARLFVAADRATASEDEAKALIGFCRERVRSLLASPRIRARILALADRLAAAGEMDEDAIHEFFIEAASS